MTIFVLVAALAALVGLASPAGALTPVTTVPLGSAAHDMKVVGSLAYVATDDGMSVLDVSNPAAPVVLGGFATAAPCQGIDVAAHAYLACQTAGIYVVNISNPAAPTLLGRLALPGSTFDVAAKGDAVAALCDGCFGGPSRRSSGVGGHPRTVRSSQEVRHAPEGDRRSRV
jgi:hypothetical protein